MSKIMLVEDDNNLREIYEARLQAEGYVLVSARDGEEALVIAKNEKPDLIISDIMMPKISGFEMLDILRNTDGLKEVKVIMLTALGQSDDQQRADRLGADRYLVKSQVTLEDIVKVAHELLQDAPLAATDSPAIVPPVTDTATVPPMTTVPEPAPVQSSTTLATNDVQPSMPMAVEPATTAESTPVVEQANIAQPTAQETAGVEAEIQDFVNGAGTDAVTPAVTPPMNDTATSMPSEPSTMSAVTDDTQAIADNDGKAMAEAVDSLMAETSQSDVELPSTAPTTITPQVSQELPAPTPTTELPTANGSVPIAHKKIITPLDTPPKQDINTLAELEEAKTVAAAPVPTPVVFASSGDTGPVNPAPANQPITITPPLSPTPDNSVDPNHIAL